jgi:hypothetical protein
VRHCCRGEIARRTLVIVVLCVICSFKSDDVACTLRHITSGQLLAVVDDEAVMIRGCEAGQKHHLWKLLSAE